MNRTFVSALLCPLIRACRRLGLVGLAACAMLRAQEGKPVLLPPYLVEGSNAPDWRYGAMPGFEMLSRCSDEISARVLLAVWRSHANFDALLDGRLRNRHSVPTLIILCPDDWKPRLPPAAEAALRLPAKHGFKELIRAVEFFPNLYFGTAEFHIAYLVEPARVATYPNTLSDAGATRELSDHVPPLPDWFIDGFASDYRSARWQWTLTAERNGSFGQLSGGWFRLVDGRSEWTSPAETDALREDPNRPRWLLPLRKLLSGETPTDPERRHVWQAQSALLVRWLLQRGEAGRRQLVQLAQTAARHPLREGEFQAIVGLDYADAYEALSDFVPSALNTRFNFVSSPTPAAPHVTLRLAHPAEIARLKAAWQEAEVEYVQESHPELVNTYAELVQKSLDRGRELGPETPDALGIRGLLALDLNDPGAARPYFEAAARGGVVRPRIYYELARLRLSLAEAHPQGTAGRLSASQVQEILDPLWQSRDQTPRSAAGYWLTLEAAARCDAAPGPELRSYWQLGREDYPQDKLLGATAGG